MSLDLVMYTDYRREDKDLAYMTRLHLGRLCVTDLAIFLHLASRLSIYSTADTV